METLRPQRWTNPTQPNPVFNLTPGLADYTTGWNLFGVSLTARRGFPAPNGSALSARLIEDTSSGLHLLQREGMPVVGSAPYRFGFFGRRVTNSISTRMFKMEVYDGPYNGNFLLFVRMSGEFFGTNPGGVGMILDSYHSRVVTDGWVQLEGVAHTTGANAVNFQMGMFDQTGTGTYVGDGQSGIDIWYPYIIAA